MFVSHRWISELLGESISVEKMVHVLTHLGLEVEGQRTFAPIHPRVVFAKATHAIKHPESVARWVVSVSLGHETVSVVSQVDPAPMLKEGVFVAVALPDAVLGEGKSVKPVAFGATLSQGVFVSEHMLGIGFENQAILHFTSEEDGIGVQHLGTSIQSHTNSGDTVLDINITPNRADCFGHRGVAREVSVGLGRDPSQLTGDAERRRIERWLHALEESCTVENTSDDTAVNGCGVYSAYIIEGVREKVSRLSTRSRLFYLGVRSISASVDITNLMMLEWSQPMHAFDADKLWSKGRSSTIQVRRARSAETLTTLDGQSRVLTSEDWVIANTEHPVALAGVMGGLETEVDQQTRRIVLESACFSPRSVRRTSKRLGLHTESSHRFERGTDASQSEWLGALAAERIAEVTGGRVVGRGRSVHKLSAASMTHTPINLVLREGRVQKLLGLVVEPQAQMDILRRLGCDVSEHPDGLSVVAPSWRQDLLREVDLIEEVARVWGYDRIQAALPRMAASQPANPLEVMFRRQIQMAAVACGLSEAINHSAYSETAAGWASDMRVALRFKNPLSHERVCLRQTLLLGLIENCARALRYQAPRVALFELGNVFDKSEAGVREVLKFGIVLSGERWTWLGSPQNFDFYDLKGAVEHVLSALGLTGLGTSALGGNPHGIWHPGRVATLSLGTSKNDATSVIGTAGELHPDYLDKYGIARPVLFAEIDCPSLMARVGLQNRTKAQAPLSNPRIARDISLTVPEDVAVQEILDRALAVARGLTDAKGECLRAIRVFDVYRGPSIPKGHKSVAFRLEFWDDHGTLTEAIVTPIETAVVEAVAAAYQATRR